MEGCESCAARTTEHSTISWHACSRPCISSSGPAADNDVAWACERTDHRHEGYAFSRDAYRSRTHGHGSRLTPPVAEYRLDNRNVSEARFWTMRGAHSPSLNRETGPSKMRTDLRTEARPQFAIHKLCGAGAACQPTVALAVSGGTERAVRAYLHIRAPQRWLPASSPSSRRVPASLLVTQNQDNR